MSPPPIGPSRRPRNPALRLVKKRVSMTAAWWRLIGDAADALGESRNEYVRRAVQDRYMRRK